jgi:hypothetical protein
MQKRRDDEPLVVGTLFQEICHGTVHHTDGQPMDTDPLRRRDGAASLKKFGLIHLDSP